MVKLSSKVKELLNKIYTGQYSHNTKLPGPYGSRFITYADYVASGQSLSFIEQFIEKSVLPSFANTHSESSYTGLQTSRLREEARTVIKSSVNANDDDVVIFTGSGSTAAIDLLNRKLVQYFAGEDLKPVVLIGPYEHHSNILPWREGAFELVELPMAQDGNVDMSALEAQLKKYHDKRPIIGSFSAASNVTGILAPVKKIHKLLKQYGALSFWDYAAAAPYVEIDMNPKEQDGIDAIFISTHKFIGGPGTPGLLVAKKALLKHETPALIGGGTVQYVTRTKQKYVEDIEAREEGGTPSILASVRAGLVFKLKETVGAGTIEKIESAYIKRALNIFSKNENIKLLGNLSTDRLGFMSFLVKHKNKYLHYNFVVALLNDLFGIQSRGGCSCAGPYGHDLLKVTEQKSRLYTEQIEQGIYGSKPGWVRLSFNYFIPEEEFTYIIEAITWISEHAWKLLNHYDFNYQTGQWISNTGRAQVEVSLDDFLSNKPALEKGNSAERILSWKANFIFANTLVKESKEKVEFTSINNETQWYPVSKDFDNDEPSKSIKIFSPWRSISQKINLINKS